MQSLSLIEIFTLDQPLESINILNTTRYFYDFSGYQLIVDQFDNAACAFLRIKPEQNVRLTCQQSHSFQNCIAGGFLGISTSVKNPLWLVDLPKQRLINSDQTIKSEIPITLSGLSWHEKDGFSIEISCPQDSVIDIIIWQFAETFAVNDIITLSPIEAQGYFLWGSHGCISKPADLYRHVIYGAVYDLRYSWPHHKKCFSENEAHALYTVFSGLEKTTGKALYRHFQQQLVLSLIQRQADDGGWYHGMWTDSSECHYRLHASGVHLLMDEYQRTGCPQVKAALQKAVAFLSKTTDRLDCGVWFLHDSLELSEQSMHSGPFRWIANKTLGKSVSNMLVLNTHLDTTIAINRYIQLTDDKQYVDLIASALKSTRAVLSLKPANWLYKPLFWAIGLTMLPTQIAVQLPLPLRALKRIAAEYLIKKLPDIKARFPRLVMPNGYIDRELSLRTWAIDYQTINLMDLARYAKAFPDEFDETILDEGLKFTHDSGLIKRYRELSTGKQYSVGFWAEALYYRCLCKPNIKYRQWLAEAMLECHDLNFGIPPSLLGNNGEAIDFDDRSKPLQLGNPELLLANLSMGSKLEYIVVNTSFDHSITACWINEPNAAIKWLDFNASEFDKNNFIIPARQWVIGKNFSDNPEIIGQ